jgi:cytochrome P450
MMSAARRPPGPARSILSSLVYFPGRDPLAFFSALSTHGDVAYARLGGEHVFLVSEPSAVRDVLVTNQRNFLKGRGLERAKRLLGKGLLTSEGALHVRQRRLIQPAFHRDRIATYARVMSDRADRLRRSWSDGATIDAAEAMNRLTLGIVAKTLFDADVDSHARDVGDALTAVMGSFWTLMLPWPDIVERLPIPALRRTRTARARLDRIIYGMIDERRRTPLDRGDLLSMLLLAQDEEAGGEGMSDEQVRDEAMTIFLAGHETTANALAWTWHLLGGATDVERRLHEEVDRVLGGRLPTIDDVPSLPFTERIVTEAMRLYPPAWIVGRRAIDECAVGGYTVPPRALVLMSPYVIQRDARWFRDPERFDPDRWSPEFKASLPPFAYFPFGGGSRRCIGESFAWVELVLVLSTIAQMWRLVPVPGHAVVPQPVVTLRTKHGVKVTTHRR